MIWIYLSQLFSNFVQASFFPFFSLWLFHTHLLSISGVAFVTCIWVMMARIPTIFIAKIVSHFEKKMICLITTFLLMLTYIAMWIFIEWRINFLILWILTTAILGLLISTNTLAILAKTANLSKNAKEKHSRFSILNIAMNLSGGVGPFLGSIIFQYNIQLLPILPILFCLISFACNIHLPKDKKEIKLLSNPNKESSAPQKNVLFLRFLFLVFFSFFVHPQFYNIFPVYAKNYFSAEFIGAMFLFSSLVTIFFQAFFNKMIQRFSFFKLNIFSLIILLLGTALLGLVRLKYASIILMGIALCSIAQFIYIPLYQTLSSEMFELNSSTALAQFNCTWGIAETIATFLGIYLVGTGHGYISYFLGCLSCFIALLLLLRWREKMSHYRNVI